MIEVTPRFIFNPRLGIYLPFHEMQAHGRSPNFLPNGNMETGSPPTGWTAIRSTISAEGTIVKSGSQSLKVVANDAGGAGRAYARHTLAAYAKYVGVTVTLEGWGRAASGNDLTQHFQIFDSVGGSGTTSTLAKDDTWYLLRCTMLVGAATTNTVIDVNAKAQATADTDDIVYADDLVLTAPQSMDRSHYGRIIHPEGVSRSLGSIGGWLFDGIDDRVTCETDPIGVNACTIVATFRATGWGGGNGGRILQNGMAQLFLGVTNTNLIAYWDNATILQSATGSIALNTVYRVVVTRTLAGITNFYINGIPSGTANQVGNAPIAGTTLLTFGNRIAGDRSFAGIIRDTAAYVGEVWTLSDVAYDYSEYLMGNR